MRKLATIRQIDDIRAIDGADAIELAIIGGWQTVVKKGEFKLGDTVAFVEIDAWVPHTLAPFLSKGKAPREYKGIQGERLRTVKLRGQLSQGLVLPLNPATQFFQIGEDVSDVLGIVKWERDIPAQLRGQASGIFPAFLRKTDQERVQNLGREVEKARAADEVFEVTLKLDGTSFTAYHKDGETGFCSRNLELKKEDASSVYAQVFAKYKLDDGLKATGQNVAIQGEILAPGVQGNREGLAEPTLFVFDIFDIDEQRYLLPNERANFFEMFLAHLGIQHAPIVCFINPLPTVADILRMADGKSLNNPVREGLVFKSLERDFSFKAISNIFLMKGGD